MTSYTDAKGSTFGYDFLGRKTSRTEMDKTSQSYTYDVPLQNITPHSSTRSK